MCSVGLIGQKNVCFGARNYMKKLFYLSLCNSKEIAREGNGEMGLTGLAVPFGTLMYFYQKDVLVSKVFVSTRKIFLKKIQQKL